MAARSEKGRVPSGGGKDEEVEEVKEDEGGGLQDRCGLRNCQPISLLPADPNPAATHPLALLLLRAGGLVPEQHSAVPRKNNHQHQRPAA